MATTTPRQLHVGFLFNAKKLRRFHADIFPVFERDETLRARVRVTPVEVDFHGDVELAVQQLDATLQRHAPFDVLVVKITDCMVAAQLRGDVRAARVVAVVEAFLGQAEASVCVLEPLSVVARVLSRSALYRVLTLCDELGTCPTSTTVGCVPWSLLIPDCGALEAALEQIPFPCVCKRDVACGDVDSHLIGVALNRRGVEELFENHGGPWVVSKYVNHGAVVHKAYVFGEHVSVEQRPSLPDLPDEALSSAQCNHVVFNSQHMPKCMDDASDAAWRGIWSQIPDARFTAAPSPAPRIEALASVLRGALQLHMFGFDVVQCSESSHLYIVDANYFPSFKAIRAQLPYLLADAVHEQHALHLKRMGKPDDLVTIVGYGSLMSLSSARRTCPSLRNFRLARLSGRSCRRVFNLVSVSLIRSGHADWSTKGVAAVSVRADDSDEPLRVTDPAEGDAQEGMLVSVFEIPRSELAAYKERENRYRFETVLVGADSAPGIICTEFSDAEYAKRCGSDEEYLKRVGQYYDGQLWRDDILPCRPYLHFCLSAAFELGGLPCVHNFLHTSYLADGTTTLAKWVQHDTTLVPELFRHDIFPP